VFRRLLTLGEAQEIVRRNISPRPFGIEEVMLSRASNRVLATAIVSSLDIPPFDRSTVDGYAVKAEDTFGAHENRPAKLKICGKANVGEIPKAEVKPGTSVEIATGAPIPKGADAVVMLEDTEVEDDTLYVRSPVLKSENIMKAGSDLRRGETILKKGTLLHSGEIGTLAAAGVAKLRVYTVPRAAVLSTGGEVVKPGQKLPPGKIYDINAYGLSAAVAESGGRPINLGVVADTMTAIQSAVRKGLASADLVVTSGGVSVGPKDLMPRVLDSLGRPGVIVCGIAIKPGKPVTIAMISGKMVFSLPGHPTSALLAFHLIVQPVIRAMAGRQLEEPIRTKAFMTTRVFPAKGRRTFIMVRLKKDKQNRLMAEPVPTGLSGAITTLARADGFVEIGENEQFVGAGEEVMVRLLTAEPPSSTRGLRRYELS
jgi:molybdenum cofactor synthesis domain-containing protein